MTINTRAVISLLLLSGTCGVYAADTGDEAMQAEIDALRARLDFLEQQMAARQQQQAPSATSSGTVSNTFNPAIGVIFSGQAWEHKLSPDDYAIPGFPAAGESGPITEGMAIGETELDFSANIDDKFTAWMTMPVVIEDGEAKVELEEAWIETTALPAGLSARMGRMYSGVGYLNSKHSHTWDFADQPLPYQALMGNQYGDDGVQLRWLAPTNFYLELSGELLRGEGYPTGGASHSGAGAWSVFANSGGDIGFDSSWLAGLSWLNADSNERASGNEDDPLLFSGESDTLIAHGVWKWAPNGNWRQRNAILQAEYIRQDDKGVYTLPGGPAADYDGTRDGWYVQGVYQPFPQWRFGARYDTLSADDPGAAFAGSALARGSDPKRYSFMVDWSNSEFSRLRLQYTHDMAGPENDNQFGLQYIFSIGAHGAHTF